MKTFFKVFLSLCLCGLGIFLCYVAYNAPESALSPSPACILPGIGGCILFFVGAVCTGTVLNEK